jgi:signal transduction histidine kinase
VRHFDGSYRNGRRRLGLAVAAVGLAAGVGSELVGFGWDDPIRWVPDLIVGLTLIGSGVWAWSSERGTGTLLTTTGFTWFAGNIDSTALYWHRGPLVHLLVAYLGWRPRSGLAVGVVGLGYCAAVTSVWGNDAASIVLSGALVAVVVRERAGTTGRLRRDRTRALRAGLALGAALIAGAIARLVVPGGEAAIPALVAYQGMLCAAAVGLSTGARWRSGPAVTDLVVELGETRSGSLRDALAHALGDPSLQIGYWQPSTGGYVDGAGERLMVPGTGQDRSARFVERDGRPFAVLIHDPAILGDPALVLAVEAATRLTASNAGLYSELRTLVAEVAASRRRLLLAGDEEQRRLEERLHDGPQQRLSRLLAALRAAASGPAAAVAPQLQRAESQLEQAVAELSTLARGLHPRELSDGLAVALRSLAHRSGVPVRLAVPHDRFSAEIEAAVYFLCAEALANVAKHAAASAASIEVVRQGARLTVVVCDDGIGGADPSRGSGLTGIADRIEALGGRLTLESAAPDGTRLAAEIPLDQPS